MKKRYLVFMLLPFLLASCGATSDVSTDKTFGEQTTSVEETETTSVAEPDTTTEPEVTTTEPEVTTTEPEVTTTEPEVTTTEPEVTTTEPEVTTTEPEVTTTEPEVTTTGYDYTIEYYMQRTSDYEYELYESVSGTVPENQTVYMKAPPTGYTSDLNSAQVSSDDQVITVHYDLITFWIFAGNCAHCKASYPVEFAYYGQEVTFTFTLDPGYEIDSLSVNDVSVEPANSITLTLYESTIVTYTVKEKTPASYTVNAYLEQLDGSYEKTLSTSYTGYVGELTDFTPAKIKYYTPSSYEKKTVASDGSTVVDVFYEHNDVIVTVGSCDTEESGKTYTYEYGEEVTFTFTPLAHHAVLYITIYKDYYPYTVTYYENPLTFTADCGEITISAGTEDDPKAAYTVNEYLEQLDGSYKKTSSVSYMGYIGDLTDFTPEEIKYYTPLSYEKKTVASDGSTVVNVFYKHNDVIVTVGSCDAEESGKTYTYKYGEEVTFTFTPLAHHKLLYITLYKDYYTETETVYENPLTFTADCGEITISANILDDTKAMYTVYYYMEELDGSYSADHYTSYAGYIGDQTDFTPDTIPGFTALEYENQTVLEDGSTKVELYYTRNTYSVSLVDSLGAASNVNGIGSYKYGEEVTITVEANTDYIISDLLLNDVSQKVTDTFTFTVSEDSVITVLASEDTEPEEPEETLYTLKLESEPGARYFYLKMDWDENGHAVFMDEVQLTAGSSQWVQCNGIAEEFLGYYIDDVLISDLDDFIYTMPAHDVTITVKVKEYDYTIEYYRQRTSDLEYELCESVSGTSPNYKDIYTLDPPAGYKTDCSSFRVGSDDQVITVHYNLITYSVYASSSYYCMVDVSDMYVYYGEEVTITFQPDSGYEMDTLAVNDVSMEPADSITLTIYENTRVTHTIKKRATASYTVNEYLEQLDGSYLVTSSTSYTGYVGDLTDIVPEEVKYYTILSYENQTIASDGSTAVNVFYKHDDVIVTVGSGDVLESGQTYTYKYGEEVTFTFTPIAHYTVVYSHIYKDYYTESVSYDGNTLTFTADCGEINISAATVENAKSFYMVYYFTENLNGSYYFDHNDYYEGYVGDLTDFTLDTIPGFTAPEFENQTILESGTRIELYYTRNTYSVSVVDSLGAASMVSGTGSYKYGVSVTVTVEGKTAYLISDLLLNDVSQGVTDTFTFTVSEDSVITVCASERAEASYTVRHYLENKDGEYALDTEESKTWYVGLEAGNASNEYEHYHVKEIQNAQILLDGSAMVDVYYDINRYEVSVSMSGKGTITGAGTYRYGDSVTITVSEVTGYTFKDFEGDMTSDQTTLSFTVEGNVSLTAVFSPKEYSYTYNYYYEHEDGTFPSVPDATENYTGYYDSLMSAAVNNDSHYTAEYDLKTITDSENVLDMYFYRNTYTLTVSIPGNHGSVTGGGSYKYNEVATLTATADENYYFYCFTGYSKYQQTITVTMTENTSITAQFNYGSLTTITVNHWLMNVDGETYTLYEQSTPTYEVDDNVDESRKEYSGYTYTSYACTSKYAEADGSTVWDFYYARNCWSFVIRYESAAVTVSRSTGREYQGVTLTVTATITDGYEFLGWYEYFSDTLITTDTTFTGVMPDEQYVIIAKTKKGNAAYTVEYYYQNIEDDEYSLGSSEIHYATLDLLTEFVPEEKDGFTLYEVYQAKVVSGGTAVVTVYYKRNSYTFTTSCDSDDYQISDGGTYRYGKDITVSFTVGVGYEFVGWYDADDNLVSDLAEYTFALEKDIDLTAKQKKILYYLVISIDAVYGTFADGSSSKTLEVYYKEEFTTPELSVSSGYIFTGFFKNDRIVVDCSGNGLKYAFLSNAEAKAKFITSDTKFYTQNDDGTITMGRYPTSLVTDTSLIATLNAMDLTFTEFEQRAYTYYADADTDYDGIPDYRGTYFTANVGAYPVYDDVFTVNQVYWYKYEPVTWKVLKTEDGKATLISDVILENQQYSSANCNVAWCDSYVRAFLNDDFINTLLMPYEKVLIPTVTVKNDLASTGLSWTHWADDDTLDQVYIPSKAEADELLADELSNQEGYINTTQYAKFRGACSSTDTFNTGVSEYVWLTRTAEPYEDVYNMIYFPYDTYKDALQLTRYSALSTDSPDFPIRPVITLNVE